MRVPPLAPFVFAAAACLAAAPPARAALLDEPPKLYTFKLDGPQAPRLPLLEAFRDAAVEPSSGLRRYLGGAWGRWRAEPWWSLAWSPQRDEGATGAVDLRALRAGVWIGGDERLFGFEPSAAASLRIEPEAAPAWLRRLSPLGLGAEPSMLETTGVTFAGNGFDALWSLPPKKPVYDWRCRRRPVRMARYGGEMDTFPLVRCDGSVAPEAFDRLTLMAREATAPRPGELLPDEPDPASVPRAEWAPGVRLVHPRLLWVIQRIADAFPWRTLYVFSGYRHDPEGPGHARPGTHRSMHSEARAMDLYVMGIPNATLFQACRALEDVGCGFYPNSKFVHVDVRLPGSGHPFWIDVSSPGEPSRYVDSWPGVVDRGALVWDPSGHAAQSAPDSDVSCTRHGGN
jgi:Peptidase M15